MRLFDPDAVLTLSLPSNGVRTVAGHNPRSTVGTVTEIHDYLRLLYARAGTPYCPEHNLPLQSQIVSQMVDAVLASPLDTRLMILAPVAREKKGEFLELFAEMQAQGFVRFRINAKAYEFDDVLLTHQFNPAVFGLALIRLVGSNGRCGTGAKGSEPGCSNPVFACQGIHH